MKIVCLGDSLTFGYKTVQYQAWPALIAKKYDAEVLNRGLNGDTTTGMLQRFYHDVAENKPSHVIIMGGTNDLIWNVPLELVQSNLATLVHHSFKYNIIPIVGIPIPLDAEEASKHWNFTDDFDGVNNGLAKLRRWIMDYSPRLQCWTVDFYKAFKDSEGSGVKKELYADGVHPTREGHRIMADMVDIRY
jgi:lysophospholipase L1-like esterase